MKQVFCCLLIIINVAAAQAQELYVKTFGNKTDRPIIFLHGGPGYNCANFEGTAAQSLADKGFFVIVYDRRGEGRSVDKNAAFTFNETFNDLQNIYKDYKLKKATLVGHSFGGIVGTLYARQFQDNVQALVLVSAPVSLQESFTNIIARCRLIYEAKKDTNNLKYLAMLDAADKSSLMYSSYCFGHAMQNGFYSPKNPSGESKHIYAKFRADSMSKNASKMTYEAPQGFFKNEHYTTLDLTADLKEVLAKKVPVYGMYGKEDGLYSTKQVTDLEKMVGKERLKYFDDCSHNVFIDQQALFLDAMVKWVGK